MDNNLGQAVNSTFDEMRNKRRQSWDWRQGEAYRYTLPERGIPYINQTQSNINNETDLEQARRLQASIFDTTVLDSANTLARSLYQGATPPHSQWFDLTLPGVSLENLTADEQGGFEEDARVLHSMIHSSNYNSAAMEIFLDYVIGGMVAIYIELNDYQELYFEHIPMFNIMVDETLKKGKIDTAYRLLNIPLTQAASFFGYDKLSAEQKEKIKEAALLGKQCTEKYEYIHCVRPRIRNSKQVRFEPDPIKRINNERWESIYVDRLTQKVVRKGGYNEFPFIISRWRCIPESPYALGPVNDTLPDVKTLNKLVQQMFRANEIAISPPLKIKNDGVINPRTSPIGPNALIKMQDTNNMMPLLTGTRYDISMGEITRMQTNIRKMLLAAELDPINKANPTAYETDRYYEIMRERLGPAYNVMHDQMIQPLIQRCYALVYRAGLIAQRQSERVQQFLAAGFLPIPEFKSPLARAGRIEDIKSLDRVVAAMAGQREMYPGILDNFDSDYAIRFYSTSIGAPSKVLRSINAVKKLRVDKQKAAEEQQARAEAMEQQKTA